VGSLGAPTFTFRQIGTIRTPFRAAAGTPIQPVFGAEVEGEVDVFEEFAAGLADLEGFERVWLIYALDRAGPPDLAIVPYRDSAPHGVFATRAPSRPNPIGLSAVRLIERSGTKLRVADLDVLDDTPLLDIKPYVPRFDAHPQSRSGWLERSAADRRVADDRFHQG
jgi:tRNA-Thr(GGU) m(6)t(6)A37 methyltransferase TsaA